MGVMDGFDPKFRTPVDYIVGCTHEIWEQRGVDLIRDRYYTPDCIVRTPLGVTTNADDVIASTHATLREFPDRQLLADDVIIGAKPSGFYSSHRVRSTATHLGHGRFAPPSGRALTMLTIADCLCRENRIFEEWLVRDQAGIARQCGLDPVMLGASIGRANPSAAPGQLALLQRWIDPNGLTIDGQSARAARLIEAWREIWNTKALDRLAQTYDRAIRLEAPGAELHYGIHMLERVLGGMLSAIPDGTFTPHHAIVAREPERPIRIAVRWSYAGRHSGHGRYGTPSNAGLAILGISHVEFRDGKIINEWMLVDELSIHAQIAVAKG
jgi:predicted ester cyclase